MTLVLLVRHARSTANASGTLSGQLPGVLLDPVGLEQAAGLGERVAGLALAEVVTSPLERAVATAEALRTGLNAEVALNHEPDLVEVDYGLWAGRGLAELAREPQWQELRRRPSGFRFPGGESVAEVLERSRNALLRHHRRIADTHGPEARWALVAHGDVIRMLVSDATGAPLDEYQRIHVDNASVSVLSIGAERTTVVQVNSRTGDLGHLALPTRNGIGGSAS